MLQANKKKLKKLFSFQKAATNLAVSLTQLWNILYSITQIKDMGVLGKLKRSVEGAWLGN